MANQTRVRKDIFGGIPVTMIDNGDGTFSEQVSGGGSAGGGVAGSSETIVTHTVNYTAAQTNTAIVSVSAGTRIVVTGFLVTCDNANTVDVAVSLGFGAATVPTGAGQLGHHPGIAPGSGFGRGSGAGVVGEGASGEDVRVTCEAPTGGSVSVSLSYYTEAA